MKFYQSLSVISLLVLFCLHAMSAEESIKEPVDAPLCPMVSEPQEQGLFQLVEVFDSEGKKNVGAPGEKVRIKFTTTNLTTRPLMVAKDFVTPQHGGMIVRRDEPEDWPEGVEPRLLPLEGAILHTGIPLQRGQMDWGHVREWISIAASHKRECDCCIRHRRYITWLDLELPDSDWKSIVLEFGQWTPVLFLGPEERAYFKSNLRLIIRRS